MKFEIKSRKLKQLVIFSVHHDYIYVNLGGKPGTLCFQACHGGGFGGNTIIYRGNNQNEFEKICKNWLRKYYKGN